MTRRDFCLGTAAVATSAALPCGVRGATALPGGKKRWYKGNLHCHTYWSDGRAFPDQAIRKYRDAGYDFCAITDHNRMGENRDFWRKVEPTEGGWPPLYRGSGNLAAFPVSPNFRIFPSNERER